MSLPVLVAMVAIGIALIIAAVHFTGGTKAAVLESEADARRRFADDFPDEQIEDVRLTQAKGSAFLRLRDGRAGVVQAIGGRFLTRIVMPAELVKVSRPDPATVSVRFRDFTWPGGDFRFAGEAEALAVMDMLDPAKAGELRRGHDGSL